MLRCFHTKRRGTRRAPDAVLWLIDDNPLATANLKAAAKAEGLTHDRLCFTRRLGYYQYAASLTEADLYLDTFPYNCGSTARDVVLAGLPMVSMAGQSVVSRMASSAMAALAANGCVAANTEQYVDATLTTLKAESKKVIHQGQITTEQKMSRVRETLIYWALPLPTV